MTTDGTDVEDASRPTWTVQLLVRGGRDAELLQGWLPPEWRLVENGERIAPSVDLLLVDAAGLEANAEAIEQARADERPRFLPVVALIPEERGGSPLRGLDAPSSIVDDVVETPVGKWELRKRLESQLHTRELSLELASREAQYRGLVELLPEAIVIVQDGLVGYANDAARRLVVGPGAETDALAGRAVASFVVEEDRERLRSLLSAVAGEGRVDEFVELRVEGADGVHECEVSGVRVTYREGEATQLVVRDVTERNRRRREVELFRRALDDADQGVTVADAGQEDLPLVYANQAFERITGYSVPEILGRNCRFLQGEATDPETVDRIRQALDAEEPVTVELVNYRKNGTPFYNELEITPVRGEDGEVTHYIGFQTDVTERVEREQRLSEFKAVLQAAADPILAVDAAGSVTTANEAFTEFVGRPLSNVLDEPIGTVLEPADALVEAVSMVSAAQATTRRLDASIVDASGERRECEVTIAPREAGQGAVVVIRDVTEARRRSQRLAVLDRLLRHNLRNKMNVVLGRSETVLHGDADPEPNLEAVVDAAEELLETVDDVRHIHDLLEGDHRGDPLELRAVVRRHLEGIAPSYPSVTVETDLDSVTVSAHSSVGVGIDQVLENAFEHNDGDEPTVRVTLERDGEWGVLTISDDGPGLPESELAVLDTAAETPLEHSQGVGLWLARWAVEHSGGKLSAVVADGTTVTVRLPLAEGGEE